MSYLRWLITELPDVPTIAAARREWKVWARTVDRVDIGWLLGDSLEVVDARRWFELRDLPVVAAEPMHARVLPHPVALTPFTSPACLLRAMTHREDGWIETDEDLENLMDVLERDISAMALMIDMQRMFGLIR